MNWLAAELQPGRGLSDTSGLENTKAQMSNVDGAKGLQSLGDSSFVLELQEPRNAFEPFVVLPGLQWGREVILGLLSWHELSFKSHRTPRLPEFTKETYLLREAQSPALGCRAG